MYGSFGKGDVFTSGGKIEDSIKKTINLSAFICSTIFCQYEKHALFAYTFAPNTETVILSNDSIVFVSSLKLSHMQMGGNCSILEELSD